MNLQDKSSPKKVILKKNSKGAVSANKRQNTSSSKPVSAVSKNEPVRLQVFLAHSGIASRRASEKLIEDGRITVNGEVVTTLGVKVSSEDTILFDGNPVQLESRKLYVLLNKPEGYICALADTHNRPIASDLLKEKYSERLYNIGRLDMFSSGALLFTNDGDFASLIQHPSSEIEKEYFIETMYDFDEQKLKDFEKGITVDGVFYQCIKAVKTNRRKLRIVLAEGKNREIRNVLRAFDIRIKKLKRIRIGNIKLGDLQSGQFRELTPAELKKLKSLAKK